jgi:hypothetical protein
LDAGFEVMRYRFPTVAAFSAIVVLPLVGIPALAGLSNAGAHLDNTWNVPGILLGLPITTTERAPQFLLSALGITLALALVGVGMAHLVTGWLVGEDRSLGDTLRHVGHRSWVIVIAWFAVLPLKALGVVACLIGAVAVLGIFLPLAAVVSAEGLGPFASIARCWRLARHSVATLGWLVVVSILLSVVLQLVIGGLVDLVRTQFLPHASWSWAIVGVLTVAFRLVLMPIQAAWAALAYLDLRVRSEGLDLELEATELFGQVG